VFAIFHAGFAGIFVAAHEPLWAFLNAAAGIANVVFVAASLRSR
jgi:hypothetical protein